MRAGLSTIQQTLTPEAAAVLNHSIGEAGRRNHGQTTPLHVAATLLASPSGFLRQACIRSHPNSSHPLQCRALELCFSVALERLPTAQNMEPGSEPPISNALMAALKRAQAHQRKGCPEQQQQPLLAVKVELEQLIISILDDPSVSRVMREASFSSPAVKATIEQSLNSNPHPHQHPHPLSNPIGHVNLGSFGGGIGPGRLIVNPQSALAPPCVAQMPNRNMYVNPKLRQGVAGQLGNQRIDEVKKILDILLRSKKRNPVLVGDSEPEAVVKEIIRKISHGELGTNCPLNKIHVISIEKEVNLDKNNLIRKIKDLSDLVENRVKDYAGVLIDLGDLKWVVEPLPNSGVIQQPQPQPQPQQAVSDAGKEAVMEMGKLLTKLTEMNNAGKVWLIGTATCETYLRCQVYHPTMENDWDLQAVPIATRSPILGMMPRLGNDRIMGNSVDPLIPLKSYQTMVPGLNRQPIEYLGLSRKVSCFQPSLEKNEHESTKEVENSSAEKKSEERRSSLPQWLQNASLHNGEINKASDQSQNKDEEFLLKQNGPELLQKKWSDACLNLHNLNRNVTSEKTAASPMILYNPKLFPHQPIQPKLMTTFGRTLQLNSNISSTRTPQEACTPPGSPVRTDLVLGRKVTEKIQGTCQETVKDFLSGIAIEPQMKSAEKFANALDAASFKKLLKGLMECAWWQPEAASAVASTVTRCQLGNGKQRASGTKGDIWLLFTGPDRIGKRKMASVLSEQMCGAGPVMISLGSTRDDKEPDTNTNRGRTALNQIVDSVRRNPFSVIMLEDIDEADLILRGNIKRAMERGRLTDSYGREISLGNVIFILTGNWSTFDNHHHSLDEKKLAATANGNWNLKLSIGEKNSKRRAHWMPDADRPVKPRIEPISGLSFDLNRAAGSDDDKNDGSYNSSDLTVDHDEELGHETRQFAITSVPQELVNLVDEAIVFKPVDFAFIRREIKKTLSVKLSMVLDENRSIQIEDNALEKIIGGLWHGKCNLAEWVDKALAPGFELLKTRLPLSSESSIVQLRLHQNSGTDCRGNGDWLPSKVAVMVDEA